MAPRSDAGRQRLAARAVVGALVLLAAIPAYLSIAPAWRPVGVRLACAALAALGCIRGLRWARGAAGAPAMSTVDAPPAETPAPALDSRFLALRDDVIWSVRSRRYFDTVLWPRLLVLAGGDLPRPADRRGIRRRGPSASALDGLVAEIERRA